MKGGKILLAALGLSMAVIGCSKGPADSTSTYVPPPPIQHPKMGTLYIANNCAIGMNIYIGTDFLKFLDGGTYYKKDVPPGLYVVKAVQAENLKPGQSPFTTGMSATVVADKTTIVSLQ